MFVDCHTHVFHPRIAEKAKDHLAVHYGIQCRCGGTAEELIERTLRAGIEHCVALCAATTAEQVLPCNRYAGQLQKKYPQITAFGSVHPDCADWKDHLDMLREMGIRGIKLHPDFQGFRLDDPRLLPIFEEAKRDFVFMIHIGDSLPPELNPSCPYKMAAVLDNMPGLNVIAAHLGGYRHWKYSLEALAGRKIWMDTSSCSREIPLDLLKRLLKKHPRERIVFGTDYPIFDPMEEIDVLRQKTGMNDAELEEVLSNGAHLLFG